jgi:hypothetical protein
MKTYVFSDEHNCDHTYVLAADAQRALDVAMADNRSYINERHENMKTIETLQAQLRQVEGERDQWIAANTKEPINEPVTYQALAGARFVAKRAFDELVKARSELSTLRQLVEALPVVDVQEVSVWLSPDESGWLVSKRLACPAGMYWAKFRTQAEADSFRALLAYRATLAAQIEEGE